MLGALPFAKSLSLMAESKILLNYCKIFTHGAHERVFYGLSRGAAVLTDPSAFLEEDFTRGLGLVEQSGDLTVIDDLVSDLCASPDTLDRLRAQGLDVYSQRHTWYERMTRVFTIGERIP